MSLSSGGQGRQAFTWADFSVWSPRRRCRVAVVDASGRALNSYRDAPLGSGCFTVPAAMYLADEAGGYRFLAFDFDDRGGSVDVTPLAGVLDSCGIEFLVAASGGGQGRHVWVGLCEAVPASLVRVLAYLVRGLCPAVDVAPLTNPVTGCCRPPGAVHRRGGISRIVRGDRRVLDVPSTSLGQVEALVRALREMVGPVAVTVATGGRTRPPLDERGLPFLAGERQDLPAWAYAVLAREPVDASTALWRVLVAAARAHWSFFEVRRLVDAPGFEHVRSERCGKRRRPRPREVRSRILLRQWGRAVAWAASVGRCEDREDCFADRAAEVVDLVEGARGAARVVPGLWSTARGAAARRVLDGLMMFALQAVSGVVEADIRRLAMTVGLSREAARVGLWDLSEAGFIRRISPAVGVRAARWALIHRSGGFSRSQGSIPTPRLARAAREGLLAVMGAEVAAYRHDVFTPGGLGLSGSVGDGVDLDELAQSLGVAGTLAAREELYWLERGLFLAFLYGAGPRRRDGARSWREARRLAAGWRDGVPGAGRSLWARECGPAALGLAVAVVVAGDEGLADWVLGHGAVMDWTAGQLRHGVELQLNQCKQAQERGQDMLQAIEDGGGLAREYDLDEMAQTYYLLEPHSGGKYRDGDTITIDDFQLDGR